MFGGRHLRRRQQRQAVDRTPVHAYFVPILEVLEELGGRGKVSEVFIRLYEKMKDNLTEDDKELLPSGTQVRWQNAAMWARYIMVKKGLLRRNSPRGVWEMTEQGQIYLEQARRRNEGDDER